MNALDNRLINNYVILIMAKLKTIEDAPEKLREQIVIKIAEREIEILEPLESEV